jgi:hypothetical protein
MTDQPDSNVSPQEQAQYDTVMIAARKNIFGDGKDDTRFKMVLDRLSKGREDLPENIGGIAAVTMSNIAGAAQKQGREVPGYILFHAGDELVDDLIEVAMGAKLAKPDQRDELKKASMFEGLKLFGSTEQRQGAVTPQAQAGYQAELQQLKGGTVSPGATPPQAAPAVPPPQRGIINAARMGPRASNRVIA